MNSPFNQTELSAFDKATEPVSESRYRKTTQEIKKTLPADDARLYALGKAAEEANKWKQAVRAYKEAIELNADNPLYFNDLGVAFVMLRRFDDAEAAFRESLRLDPGFPNARFNLKDLEIQKQARMEIEEISDPAEQDKDRQADEDASGVSIEQLKLKIRQNPDNYLLWIGLANLHLKDEQFQDAARCLRRAAKLKPDRAATWWSLARAQQHNNRLAAAITALERYLSLSPDCPHGWVRLSKLLFLAGKKKRGITCGSKAIQIGSDRPSAWRHWAWIAENHMLDDVTAESARRKVAELEPDSAPDWFQLGLVLQKRADRQGAVRAFKKALSSNPNNNDYWMKLGRALESIGEAAAAEELYQMLLKKAPDESRAWNSLGVLKSIEGDQQAAKDCFEKALEIEPDFSNAWYNLRDLKFVLGDEDGARIAEKRARAAV